MLAVLAAHTHAGCSPTCVSKQQQQQQQQSSSSSSSSAETGQTPVLRAARWSPPALSAARQGGHPMQLTAQRSGGKGCRYYLLLTAAAKGAGGRCTQHSTALAHAHTLGSRWGLFIEHSAEVLQSGARPLPHASGNHAAARAGQSREMRLTRAAAAAAVPSYTHPASIHAHVRVPTHQGTDRMPMK